MSDWLWFLMPVVPLAFLWALARLPAASGRPRVGTPGGDPVPDSPSLFYRLSHAHPDDWDGKYLGWGLLGYVGLMAVMMGLFVLFSTEPLRSIVTAVVAFLVSTGVLGYLLGLAGLVGLVVLAFVVVTGLRQLHGWLVLRAIAGPGASHHDAQQAVRMLHALHRRRERRHKAFLRAIRSERPPERGPRDL